MSAEEVPPWELEERPAAGGADTWERKLEGMSSSISWGSINQPAVVLQRFFRSVTYLRKIKEAVHYHARHPDSRRRLALLQQLIDTEKRYVKSLAMITNGFVVPLRKESNRPADQRCVSPEAISTIFGTVEAISHIHKELIASLTERQGEQWLSMNVGDLFAHLLVPRVELYSRYADGMTNALICLEENLKNPPFVKLVRQLELKCGLGWPTIGSLLRVPLTRMQTYPEILQELLLVSSLDHEAEEFYSLSRAACVFQDTNLYMSERWGQAEGTMRSRNLCRTLVGFQQPPTPLVREGFLKNVTDPDTIWYFLLYTNVLLGAKRTERGFQVCKRISLDDISVDEDSAQFSNGATVLGDPLSTRSLGTRNGFVVCDNAGKLEVATTTQLEKQQWIEDIQKCIQLSKTAQVMRMYSGFQGRLDAVVERAALVDERIADEQAITAQVAARALDTIDELIQKTDELSSALGSYEDGILWPQIVKAFVDKWNSDQLSGSKEEIIQAKINELISPKFEYLQRALMDLDQSYMQKVEELISQEGQSKDRLTSELTRIWDDVEQQFGAFERDMEMLEKVMDFDGSAKRAELLSDCDSIQQQLYGLDKKILPLQTEKTELDVANQQLAQEIAERSEELRLTKERLAQL